MSAPATRPVDDRPDDLDAILARRAALHASLIDELRFARRIDGEFEILLAAQRRALTETKT